jgi:hypothetical protein
MKTEIEIPVAELKAILPGLGKIVGRTSSLPVLNCIKVQLDKDQQFVTLQANNLDEIATVRLQNRASGLSGDLLVPFEMLSKIVKGCAADQSIRLITNGEQIKIRYNVGGSPVERPVDHIAPVEWPETKVIDQEEFALDETFKQSLKEAMECSSEDASRYVLGGACLDIRDKAAHYLVGTNGHHLYSANSFAFRIPEPLIVQSRKFVTWPGFVNDGPWKLRMLPAIRINPKDKKADRSKERPPWLQIDSERWCYIAKAIDADYPKWKEVVPVTNEDWTRISLEASAMQMMLDAIPLLPGADLLNQPLALEITHGGLFLKARSKEQKDWTTIHVPDVRITGKPVECLLNRIYFVRALRFGFNEIQILNAIEPLVLVNGAKTIVIMPVKGDAAEKYLAAQKTPPSLPQNAAAVPPSAAGTENQTETKIQTMQTTTTATTPSERGNSRVNNNGNAEGEETRSSFKAALEHIDRIKVNLKDVMGDLSDAASMLKSAEKEQRATTKEIDTVRSKLREIQSVKF